MDVESRPDNAPESCPGTESENAGKASACDGCPNQSICQSAPKGPDPNVARIAEKLSGVKNKIIVMSCKGGVGKSSVCGQLAFALAEDEDLEIGVLDVDLCGPSMPIVMGVQGQQAHADGQGYTPVYAEANLAVMSIGFLLEHPDDPVIWRGNTKNGMIMQFLRDMNWGELDYLLIDTPPGTSDEQLAVVKYLSAAGVTGAIIVTTPQEVALADVRKGLTFCNRIGLNVLGVVENMSLFVCPKCHKSSEIFPPTSGGAEKMCTDFQVPFLGKIPLDSLIGQACDKGESVVRRADTPAAFVYEKIANQIKAKCSRKHDSSPGVDK